MGLKLSVSYDLAHSTSALDRLMAEKLSSKGISTIRTGTVAYQDDAGVYIRSSHRTGTIFIPFKDLL